MAQQAVQKNTMYVGGLAEEVNESILHAAFIPFGDIKDVKTPLDQATQKHRSFGFVTFLEREDAAAAMDNMDGAELYGRVLTVNYALPEKIKGGEQGWAAQPIWADADTWFERQQQEEEMQRIQAENKAAMQAAEELHRKKLTQEREGEKEEEIEMKDDPISRAEAEEDLEIHVLTSNENYAITSCFEVLHVNHQAPRQTVQLDQTESGTRDDDSTNFTLLIVFAEVVASICRERGVSNNKQFLTLGNGGNKVPKFSGRTKTSADAASPKHNLTSLEQSKFARKSLSPRKFVDGEWDEGPGSSLSKKE
ncbi:unnamed protein product [Malus baccata var. baccata]